MTFATGHNLVNVVPGDTRVQVTGNSNSALNTNYYVLSILSPTQLSVAWGQANFAASATNCTATFSPSGFVENSVSVGAQTSVGINKLFPGNGLLYGQTWSLSAADVNLPKHAGESFTFSACSAGTNPTISTASPESTRPRIRMSPGTRRMVYGGRLQLDRERAERR